MILKGRLFEAFQRMYSGKRYVFATVRIEAPDQQKAQRIISQLDQSIVVTLTTN